MLAIAEDEQRDWGGKLLQHTVQMARARSASQEQLMEMVISGRLTQSQLNQILGERRKAMNTGSATQQSHAHITLQDHVCFEKGGQRSNCRAALVPLEARAGAGNAKAEDVPPVLLEARAGAGNAKAEDVPLVPLVPPNSASSSSRSPSHLKDTLVELSRRIMGDLQDSQGRGPLERLHSDGGTGARFGGDHENAYAYMSCSHMTRLLDE